MRLVVFFLFSINIKETNIYQQLINTFCQVPFHMHTLFNFSGGEMNWITYPLQSHHGMTQNGSLSCSFHPVTLSCSGTGCHCKDRKGHLRQKDCVSGAWLGWISSFGQLWWGSLECKPEIGNSQICIHAMLVSQMNKPNYYYKHKSSSL